MCRRLIKYVLTILLVLPVSLAPEVSMAGHIAMSQQSDGTLAYIGFMHSDKLAQNIKRYPKLYKSHDAGKIQTGRFKYHVTAVLFDADSNKRITDAEVWVRVSPLGFGGSYQLLKPMETSGVIEYCNNFNISPDHRYIVDLRINRTDRPTEIRMRFNHELPY